MIDKRNTLARHYGADGAVGGDGDDEDGHRG